MSLALKLALAPLLVAQAVATKRRAPRLPEADGPREGRVGEGERLSLLIVGDSSAAGVGVRTQDDALAGYLTRTLAREARRRVHWQLVAQSGITTAQALELARRVRPMPAEIAVAVLGVNDVIDQVPSQRAVLQRAALADWLRQDRRCAPRGVRAAAAGAPLPAAAAALAPRDGRRCTTPRRRDGTLGGDTRRRLACGDPARARPREHGRGRIPSRRAGLPRLRRSAGTPHRRPTDERMITVETRP
ncbi:MAG: GDSL-type esterase/lipase family protein [Piscinibacter sp.]